MSTYHKTIKATCSCGGSIEVSDNEGTRAWSREVVDAWQTRHAVCLQPAPQALLEKLERLKAGLPSPRPSPTGEGEPVSAASQS